MMRAPIAGSISTATLSALRPYYCLMSKSPAVILGKPLASPARNSPPERGCIRVATVQEKWQGSIDLQKEALELHVKNAVAHDAQFIAFSEMTLSPYLCFTLKEKSQIEWNPENFENGPSLSFMRQLSSQNNIFIVASLYEANNDGLGYNTAFGVAPSGEVLFKQRKTHLPITAGYYEDSWFSPEESGNYQIQSAEFLGAKWGAPTCWDQWFPELARMYGLAATDILVYPTAIGSEPDFVDFDTAPMWRTMMISHAIANGMAVIAPNRVGVEGPNTFYGTSFICDQYGRVLVEADRSTSTTLIADIDLDAKRDWLTLFPFFETRRPDLYGAITKEKHV